MAEEPDVCVTNIPTEEAMYSYGTLKIMWL